MKIRIEFNKKTPGEKKKRTVAEKAKIWTIVGWIVMGILVALTIASAGVYFAKVKAVPALDTTLPPEEYQAKLEEIFISLRPYLIWFIVSQALCVFSAIAFFSIQSTFTSNYIIHKENKK